MLVPAYRAIILARSLPSQTNVTAHWTPIKTKRAPRELTVQGRNEAI
jgi:hypothetical protein